MMVCPYDAPFDFTKTKNDQAPQRRTRQIKPTIAICAQQFSKFFIATALCNGLPIVNFPWQRDPCANLLLRSPNSIPTKIRSQNRMAIRHDLARAVEALQIKRL